MGSRPTSLLIATAACLQSGVELGDECVTGDVYLIRQRWKFVMRRRLSHSDPETASGRITNRVGWRLSTSQRPTSALETIGMCGRFTVYGEVYEIKIAVSAQVELLFRPWAPRYNIAPSAGPGHEQLIAVTEADGNRALRLARWWFIPSKWPKPLNKLPTTFNARAEEISQKPLWKSAIKAGRCLVPATGWREFVGTSGKKQPYHFHFEGDPIFAFAGLKSTWTSPEGEVVDTFAILTTEANDVVKPIHDRMPMVVPSSMYDAWLNTDEPLKALNEIVTRNRQLPLLVYPSDPAANDTRFEGPTTIRRVEPATNAAREEPAQQSLFGFAYDVPEKPARRHRRA